jgi:hypothetical protein
MRDDRECEAKKQEMHPALAHNPPTLVAYEPLGGAYVKSGAPNAWVFGGVGRIRFHV